MKCHLFYYLHEDEEKSRIQTNQKMETISVELLQKKKVHLQCFSGYEE